ncbi:C39 family peptidase [Corynebacterium sp. 20_84]
MSGFELPNYLDDMTENFADEPMTQPDYAEEISWPEAEPITVEPRIEEQPAPEAQPAPEVDAEPVPETQPAPEESGDAVDESTNDFADEFTDDYSDDSFSEPAEEVPSDPEWEETAEPTETVVPAVEDNTEYLPADEGPAIENSVINEEFFLNDGVAGGSYLWQDIWFSQEVDGYCGPTAAAFLLNQFTGAGINNPEFMVEQAVNMGYMGDPTQGMTVDNLAKLLTSCGLPAEAVQSGIYDLAAKLEMGYGVIACVDSGELWGDEEDMRYEDNTSDHVLVVSEIDFNMQTVTLLDSGFEGGDGFEVPLDQFLDAWEDSNFAMVTTTQYSEALVDSDTQYAGWALVNATGSDVIH